METTVEIWHLKRSELPGNWKKLSLSLEYHTFLFPAVMNNKSYKWSETSVKKRLMGLLKFCSFILNILPRISHWPLRFKLATNKKNVSFPITRDLIPLPTLYHLLTNFSTCVLIILKCLFRSSSLSLLKLLPLSCRFCRSMVQESRFQYQNPSGRWFRLIIPVTYPVLLKP